MGKFKLSRVNTFHFDAALVGDITSGQPNLKIQLRSADFVRVVAAVVPSVADDRCVEALSVGAFKATGAVHRIFLPFVVGRSAGCSDAARQSSVAVAQHTLLLLPAIPRTKKMNRNAEVKPKKKPTITQN